MTVKNQDRFGDDKEVDVMGRGTLTLTTKKGDTTLIYDTLHVPKLEHNILSIGQLLETNYKVVFEDKCCKIFDKSSIHHLVEKTYMTDNRLFPLTLGSTRMHPLKATTDDLFLCHQ